MCVTLATLVTSSSAFMWTSRFVTAWLPSAAGGRVEAWALGFQSHAPVATEIFRAVAQKALTRRLNT